MKYVIKIKEILERSLEVEADNKFKAAEKVQRMYNNSEIVLTHDDFSEMYLELPEIE